MKKNYGFTLLELILVIIVMGIIAGMASKLMNTGFSAYLAGKNVVDADWQGRLAMEMMVRDLRAIRSANDISTAIAAQIIFTDTNNASITYQLTGSSLMRNAQILADGVSNLALSYYDATGTITTTPSAIRYINLTLTITKNNANYSLTTAINPRNVE